MKGNVPLYSFNAGEVSKQALARVDVAKLRLAAACQVNWMPWVIGPMMLRPGLQFIGEVRGDLACKLIPFVFSKLDTALLELTPNQMRIWINDQLVTRVAVSTTITDPTFVGGGTWSTSGTTAGATATIGGGFLGLTCAPRGGLAQAAQTISVAAPDIGKEHGIRIVVTNGPVTVRCGSTSGAVDLIPQTVIDTGTHCLTCTPTGSLMWLQIESTDQWTKSLSSVTIDAAGALVVPTPWAAGDLPNLRTDASGDVIFVGCYGMQQRKIERRAPHAWSVVLYRSSDGPFQAGPSITANFQPNAMTGTGRLTSTRPYFQPEHVGCLFRLFTPGQQNQTVLGANGVYSEAVRVTGVGVAMRDYSWTVTGTWAGSLTLQRSLDGPDSGFRDVSSITANGILTSTSGTGETPNLDNVIAWERVGFKDGQYTSGAATVVSGYSGGGRYGICRATSFVSQVQVGIEILQSFSSVQPTADWVEADWSNVLGWPTAPQFHEGRLAWVGSNREWFSASDAFTSFGEIDEFGDAIGDAGPIALAFGSGPVDTVSWGLSLTRFLAGREQSISSTRSSNFDQPLTPSAIVVRDCSDQGAQRLPAVKVGKRGIFVQQSGRRVYELAYSPGELDYDERDLTRLNTDIGALGFTGIAASYQPDKTVWLPRGDGQVAALLYDVKDEVEAWWRLQTLGVVEGVCVLPSSGIEDQVYFVVKRLVNGATVRFIEKLARRDQCVGGLQNIQADCCLVYSGSPVSSVALPWLPNTQVVVWADGLSIGTTTTDGSGNCLMPDSSAHSFIVVGLGGSVVTGTAAAGAIINSLAVGSQYAGAPCEVFADVGATGKAPIHLGSIVVDNTGAITLPFGKSASTIVACVGYVAPFQSAKLAYAAQMGSALTMKKKLDHVGLVMFDTHYQGVRHGQRFDALDNLPLIEADQVTAAGTVWSEYDDPTIELAGEWYTDARLCLLAQAPSPCTIGGLVAGITTTEKS